MARYLSLFSGLKLGLRIGSFLIDSVLWLMIGLLFLADWVTQRQQLTRWKKDSAKPAVVK